MTTIKSQYLDRVFRIVTHGWIATLVFSIFMAEVFAIVLGGLWLWRRLKEPRISTALDRPVLLFFALRLLAIVAALSPAASLLALRKIPFILIFFPLSELARRQGAPEVVKLLRTFALAAMIASLYGLVKILVEGSQRLHSTTSGPTTFAMLLAASFAIALALLASNVFISKKFWFPGLASTLVAMAFTHCRAPWLASSLVGLSLLLKHARREAMLFLVAIITILALLPSFRMRYEEVLQWPHLMGDRPVIWQKGWELVQARPALGYGPESFHLVFDQHQHLKDKRVGAWHNFILQLWVESGLLSVLAFGWVLWKAFSLGRLGLRSSPSPETRTAARALLAGITTLLLAGLFGGLMGDPIVDMLFWGMIGMMAGFRCETNTAVASRQQPVVF